MGLTNKVEVKQIPKPQSDSGKRELYASVAYSYPQYTLEQIEKMPARDVELLIKVARRMEANKMYNMTQIVAAPHTHKAKAVKKLLDHFTKASR